MQSIGLESRQPDSFSFFSIFSEVLKIRALKFVQHPWYTPISESFIPMVLHIRSFTRCYDCIVHGISNLTFTCIYFTCLIIEDGVHRGFLNDFRVLNTIGIKEIRS